MLITLFEMFEVS